MIFTSACFVSHSANVSFNLDFEDEIPGPSSFRQALGLPPYHLYGDRLFSMEYGASFVRESFRVSGLRLLLFTDLL